MATVYAKKINNVLHYKIGATSINDVTAGDPVGTIRAALVAAGLGGTLYIGDGTYSGADIHTSGIALPYADQTVVGLARVVLINGMSDYIFKPNLPGAVFRNLMFEDNINYTGLIYCQPGAGLTKFDNCIYKTPNRFLTCYDTTAQTTEVTNCFFLGGGNNYYSVVIEGVSVLKMKNSVISPDSGGYPQPIRVKDNASALISSCDFIGFTTYVFLTANLGTIDVKNSIIIANGASSLGSVVALPGGGAINIAHSSYQICPENPSLGLGVTPGDGVISDRYSKVTAPGYNDGYVIFTIDDAYATSISYAIDVANLCEDLGVNFTWFVDQKRMMDYVGHTDLLKDMVSAGNEIGCHSYSHSQLTSTTAFSIVGSGTSPTITISRTLNAIICSDVESGNQVVSNFTAKSILEIKDEINSFANWTAGANTAGFELASLGESLADVLNYDVSSSYTLLLDRSTDCSKGFFKVEILNPKLWLESQIGGGYQVDTLSYPGGRYDDDVRAAVKSAGYISARCSNQSQRYLKNIELFTVNCYGENLLGDRTETTIKNYGAATATNALASGKVFVVLSHNASEITITELRNFLTGALTVDGIQITSLKNMANRIRSSGLWVDADENGKRWTRTFVDASNYHLQLGSPCIDKGAFIAGVNMEGQVDPWGKKVYGIPNIGADQGAGAPKSGSRQILQLGSNRGFFS